MIHKERANVQLSNIKRRALEVEIEQLRGLVREQAESLDIIKRQHEKELIEAHSELSQAQDKVMAQKETIEELQDKLESTTEANDLREWRRGLVKPAVEKPNDWPVIVRCEHGKIRIAYCLSGFKAMGGWFDPRDIFKAADRDAEKENKE